MNDIAGYRSRFQDEIESSIADILCVVQQSAFGEQEVVAARSVERSFFKIGKEVRLAASLDPRIVFCVEEIQRLVARYGTPALVRSDLKTLVRFILRLDLYTMFSTQRSGHFSLDCPVTGTFSIPGTSIYLHPNGLAREIAVVDGVIDGNFGHPPAPAAFGKDVSGLGIAHLEEILRPPIQSVEILSLYPEERTEWESAIARAIDLISYHRSSANLVAEFGWLLVPIRNDRAGHHLSISFSSLPNAIFASFQEDAASLAETLVHESDHNWFYLISRFENFWQEPVHLQRAMYRSPWRDDPRPLDGILRGASAFVRVGSLWAALLATLPERHASLDWIRRRVFLCNLQAVDALRTLINADGLSIFGRQQVEAWSVSAADTHRAIMVEKPAQAYLLAAFDEQRQHDHEWTQRNSAWDEHSSLMSLDSYFSFVQRKPSHNRR